MLLCTGSQEKGAGRLLGAGGGSATPGAGEGVLAHLGGLPILRLLQGGGWGSLLFSGTSQPQSSGAGLTEGKWVEKMPARAGHLMPGGGVIGAKLKVSGVLVMSHFL